MCCTFLVGLACTKYNGMVCYIIVLDQDCMEYQYDTVSKLARLSYGVVVTVKIYVIELPDKLKDVKYTMMLAHDIPMNHQPFWESISMQHQTVEPPNQQPTQLSDSPEPFL